MYILVLIGFFILLILVCIWIDCRRAYYDYLIKKEGYEVIDLVKGNNLLGEPIYNEIVRYKDGSVESISIPSEKYYEKNRNE